MGLFLNDSGQKILVLIGSDTGAAALLSLRGLGRAASLGHG
jgi:hypothetical protein